MTLNTCVQCKKGTYQNEMEQTSCIPCPINTSTRDAGAVSIECYIIRNIDWQKNFYNYPHVHKILNHYNNIKKNKK